MEKTVADIAALVDGRVCGDAGALIKGVAGIQSAAPGDLTFLLESRYQDLLSVSRATAVIVGQDHPEDRTFDKTLIQVPHPAIAFERIAACFRGMQEAVPGISPKAEVDPTATVGEGVSIAAFAVIGPGVRIGDRTRIGAGVFIGSQTTIGTDCLIHPRVTILHQVVIGDRVILQSGAVIGSDGFGYETVDGKHRKIPQVGGVILEDDVEIGANTTIDRARVDQTIVKRGTKIDNLVHIAHNVVLGEDCLLLGQVGIAGSTVFGNRVICAGQAGIAGHVRVGEDVVIGSQSGVTKSIPDGKMVSGFPAISHNRFKRVSAATHQLPQILKKLKSLEIEVERLKRGSP